MEETVEAFSKIRDVALKVARDALAAQTSPKRKSDELEQPTEQSTKRIRTSARLSSRTEQSTPPPPPPPVEDEPEEIIQDSDGDEDEYEPPENREPFDSSHMPLYENANLTTADGMVPCPSCQRKMKAWQVFTHLESCPGPVEEPPQRTDTIQGRQQRQQQKQYERLPALNYSMFKEQALRKKLGDLGISNQGPRHLLEKRHKEWITIWNANCDAAKPKRRNELLHDLDVWERTQGGKAPTMGKAVQNAIIIKDKEFDGAAWASKHDTSFKDLIANARKSRLEAKKKAEEGKDEATESAAQPAANGIIHNDHKDTAMENSTNPENGIEQPQVEERETLPGSPTVSIQEPPPSSQMA